MFTVENEPKLTFLVKVGSQPRDRNQETKGYHKIVGVTAKEKSKTAEETRIIIWQWQPQICESPLFLCFYLLVVILPSPEKWALVHFPLWIVHFLYVFLFVVNPVKENKRVRPFCGFPVGDIRKPISYFFDQYQNALLHANFQISSSHTHGCRSTPCSHPTLRGRSPYLLRSAQKLFVGPCYWHQTSPQTTC